MADVIEKLKEYAQYAETKSERDTFEVAFQEIARLREENARLRGAVKAAYYEGWQDNASIDDTEDRLHAEWEHSEARVAICETSK